MYYCDSLKITFTISSRAMSTENFLWWFPDYQFKSKHYRLFLCLFKYCLLTLELTQFTSLYLPVLVIFLLFLFNFKSRNAFFPIPLSFAYFQFGGSLQVVWHWNGYSCCCWQHSSIVNCVHGYQIVERRWLLCSCSSSMCNWSSYNTLLEA